MICRGLLHHAVNCDTKPVRSTPTCSAIKSHFVPCGVGSSFYVCRGECIDCLSLLAAFTLDHSSQKHVAGSYLHMESQWKRPVSRLMLWASESKRFGTYAPRILAELDYAARKGLITTFRTEDSTLVWLCLRSEPVSLFLVLYWATATRQKQRVY